MLSPHGEITEILQRLSAGETSDSELLIKLTYERLHGLAVALMRQERDDHTLQPTALVHLAWLRLDSERKWDLKDRGEFFAAVARLMRHILVDHARGVNAKKRGGGQAIESLESAIAVAAERPECLLDVDRALQRFEQLDPVRARVVELRFYGGLSIDETAQVLGISSRQVDRHWKMARAWLIRELKAYGP